MIDDVLPDAVVDAVLDLPADVSPEEVLPTEVTATAPVKKKRKPAKRKYELTRKERAAERQQLKESLGKWYLKFNPNYKYVAYQQERIIPALERLARREGKLKLLVQMPPGHAKSDLGTKAFVPWYLGNHKGHSAMTLCYGDDLALDFGRHIKNICESELALYVFPGLKLAQDSRGNRKFSTMQGNEYYACGFDSTISGRRLDFLGIDDPVKNMKEAESQTAMAGRFDIYRSTCDHRMKPGGICAMFLHRFSITDFAAYVLDKEGDEWEVLTIPAEDEHGKFIWESHFGAARYERIKTKDPEVWSAMYMQKPGAFNEYWFPEEWWHTYKAGSVSREWQHYMICDPGLMLEKKHDRTSILVVAAGPEKRMFVVDWVYDWLDPDQRADAICRLLRKWKPRRFVYEELGLTSDTFYLNKRLKDENFGSQYKPIPVGRHGKRAMMSKEQRIGELRSDFRDALLWFPEKLMYQTVEGTQPSRR